MERMKGLVEGSGELTFEPFRDMQGKPAMLVDSVFGDGTEARNGPVLRARRNAGLELRLDLGRAQQGRMG